MTKAEQIFEKLAMDRLTKYLMKADDPVRKS